MLDKIKEEERILFEVLSHPKACAEILFHDFDDLGSFSDTQYGEIRKYQIPFLSFDTLFCEDNKITKKQNFELKKGMSECFALGGRMTGKSLIHLIIDVLTSMFHKTFNWGVVSSSDLNHVRGVMEKILTALKYHPVFKLFKVAAVRSPAYSIRLKNGCLLESVNNNLSGKNPGGNWFGKHVQKNWEEESSFLTDTVTGKKRMAESELGCIYRLCILKGTKILMSDFSTKNIELIESGDKIISWDEEKRQLVESVVKNKFCSGKRDVIKITDNRNELWLTSEHKIRCRSSGDNVYKWREAIGCASYEYYTKTINYINNLDNYLYGLLLGLIESDGSHYKIRGKEKLLHQFIIHQSDEVDFIDWLLTNLKITYTKVEQKKHGWNKKIPYRFLIHRENNEIILEHYKKLEKDKDIKYGFLMGFVIGDGYIAKEGNLSITQSYKTNAHKIEYVEKILNSLNIYYNKYLRESNKTASIYFGKYDVPCYSMPCNKMMNQRNHILNIERPIFNKEQIKLKGFKENQEVYDIETETHSFIANGFIVHNSGMTTFSKMSPMGKLFYDLKNKSKIVNLPSYINASYDEKRDNDAIQEFGGKNSHGYQVQILGKVVETGDTVFDMDRIRDTYRYTKRGDPLLIKSFEINKDNYLNFKERIILDKPFNVEQTIVALDKGEGAAPTEIIILFKIQGKFKYEYNITLFKLKSDEDEEIIDFIIEKIKPNIVGIDYTSGTGKTLFIHLSKKYPENIIGVSFNEKIEIDFEKDEKGNMKHDNSGKPIFKTELVTDWSVQCLKDIFYNNKIECLVDYKLDTQISGVISATSKQGKPIFGYKTENHLFQAFQVFSIINFLAEFKNIKPIQVKKPGLGAY